ncbi:hypothetical protein [Noviherbaspirillum sp.]|uniref:hypothetical protein n=1 Tax=Noviherbaspirillum sp. TaxID=1926288 RepID=UPI002D619C6C|nr:hypothetical protein [Noviherbaspirillum sp.]HZW23463.1 hypothetical protein [Noviherbaspirillum sp.]
MDEMLLKKTLPKIAFRSLIALAISASNSIFASNNFRPGEYLQERGWGTLTVMPGSSKGQPFSIQTLGPNTHTCELEGLIQGTRANLDVDEGEKKCVIHFQPTKDGIDVTIGERTDDLCGQFCGVRAWFTGMYLTPHKGCIYDARSLARKRFIDFYKKRNYRAARAELEPILHSCSKTLHMFEDGEIRNDLAITQYHLKDYSGCLKTLTPLTAYARMTSEQIKEEFAPMDADVMESIARSARTNIGLCSKKAKDEKK